MVYVVKQNQNSIQVWRRFELFWMFDLLFEIQNRKFKQKKEKAIRKKKYEMDSTQPAQPTKPNSPVPLTPQKNASHRERNPLSH